jgi:hypothetical protein
MLQEHKIIGTKMRPVRCTESMSVEAAKLLLEYMENVFRDQLKRGVKASPRVVVAYSQFRDIVDPIIKTADASGLDYADRFTLEARF